MVYSSKLCDNANLLRSYLSTEEIVEVKMLKRGLDYRKIVGPLRLAAVLEYSGQNLRTFVLQPASFTLLNNNPACCCLRHNFGRSYRLHLRYVRTAKIHLSIEG